MSSFILTYLFSPKLYIFFIWLSSITDEEYIRFAVAEGKRFQDSFEIIALLKKSYESYGNLKVQRMGSFCGFQMAKEYYAADDCTNAKQLFESVQTRGVGHFALGGLGLPAGVCKKTWYSERICRVLT